MTYTNRIDGGPVPLAGVAGIGGLGGYHSLKDAMLLGRTVEDIVADHPDVAVPTFFGELSQELRRLDAVIGSGQDAVYSLRERAFGSWPEPGSLGAQGAAQNGPPPACESLLDFVRQLISRAERTAESAKVLNARL